MTLQEALWGLVKNWQTNVVLLRSRDTREVAISAIDERIEAIGRALTDIQAQPLFSSLDPDKTRLDILQKIHLEACDVEEDLDDRMGRIKDLATKGLGK